MEKAKGPNLIKIHEDTGRDFLFFFGAFPPERVERRDDITDVYRHPTCFN